ncbi:MAG: hypothetical protein ACW98U_05975 [Candidatus Thorarchaeota archaeon]|jgi:hypothetical protein
MNPIFYNTVSLLEGSETAEGSFKTIAVATIIVVAISSTAFFYLSSLSNDSDITNSLEIVSLQICGNSTDILYPELMEAFIVFQESNWTVSANFVDDSEGWENPEIYDREFSVTPEEIEMINLRLHEGLNGTHPSEISPSVMLESNPHIGFGIEIMYTDGSWIYITTFQTDEGHIISNNGIDTIDRNLLSGTVLEPISALDSLVLAIHALFSNHLDVT